MYNYLDIGGTIMIYSGLIGIGIGLAMMYIGNKFDIYNKSSNICLDCNNKISNDTDDSGDNNDVFDTDNSNDIDCSNDNS